MLPCLRSYQRELNLAFESIAATSVQSVCKRLLTAHALGETVYLAGNGGSAALANHFACDLEKTTAGAQPLTRGKRMRAVSLNANTALLTAWANDEGYEHVFAQPLHSHARSGDLFIAISGSGNSPNIVRALEMARAKGLNTVGLLGFDGGRCLAYCDHAIHVRSSDYGVIEGLHSVVTHLITRTITQALSAATNAADVLSGALTYPEQT